MKTKKLVELLNYLDPTGELNVWCDGKDILHGNTAPAYYDGYNHYIETDEDGRYLKGYYDIASSKVELEGRSFSDCIEYDPEFEIDYSALPEKKANIYRESHDKIRRKEYNFQTDFDFRSFLEFCAGKAGKTGKSLDGLTNAVKKFFSGWYNVKTGFTWHPIHDLTWDTEGNFSIIQKSVHDRQTAQWHATINVKLVNSGIYDEWIIEEVPHKHYPKEFLDKAEVAYKDLCKRT